MVQLVLLLAGSCLPVLASVLIAPVLPSMAAAFATTPGVDVLVPVALTAPALIVGLTSPIAGLAVDALDRRRLLVAGLLAYAVLGVLPVFLDSLYAIVASRVALGLAEAAVVTCCLTLISDNWGGARRSRHLGMQVLVSGLSATVVLLLGGALGVAGWRVPFWLYGITVLMALATAAGLRLPDRVARSQRVGTLAPVRWSVLLVPCGITLLGSVWFDALIVELPFVLTERGVASSALIGLAAAAMPLATAAGALVTGRVSGRGPRILLPLELVLTAVGQLMVGLGPTVPVIVVGALIAGFGTGMLLPTLMTWTANRLTADERGRGTGLWMTAFNLGQFSCPLVIAAVAAATGGLAAALAVLEGAALIMAVAVRMGVRGDEPLNAGVV